MLGFGAMEPAALEPPEGQLRSDMVKTEVVPDALFLSAMWNRIATERAVLLELRERGDCRSASAWPAARAAYRRQADRRCVHWSGAGKWLECHNGSNTYRGGIPVDQRPGRCGLSRRLDRHP